MTHGEKFTSVTSYQRRNDERNGRVGSMGIGIGINMMQKQLVSFSFLGFFSADPIS